MISALVTIGALVSAAASIPYILAVIRGTVRPRLVSWTVWAVLAGVSRLDILCLVGAAMGIASLVVFKNPLIALGVSVAVDIVAFIPTLVHAWVSPHEESLACFALSATGGILAVMAVVMGDISLAALLYPVYSMIFNGVAALLILSGRTKLLPWQQQRYGEEV